MKPNDYLKNLIETIPIYSLTEDDKKCIQFEGIETYIYKKITSTRFKEKSVPIILTELVKKEIHYCVSNKLPIHIVLPFGAYKKTQFPTAPGIDFAEVFNMILFREYLMPIVEAYEYGATMEYYSVELFVSRNNHIPQQNIDKYNAEFQKLINLFNEFCPPKLKYKFTNLRSVISQEDAWKAIDKKRLEIDKLWDTYDDKQKEFLKRKALISCVIDSNNPNYEKILLESVLDHEAFSTRCWDNNGQIIWRNAPDMITVGHSYTGSWAIQIKSSKSSSVCFWVGIGALNKQGDSYLPTILTYEQFLKSKDLMSFESIDCLTKDLSDLNSIPVISK